MNKSNNEQYLKEGINAIVAYEKAQTAKAINQVAEKLNLQSSLKDFEEKASELIEIGFKDKKALHKFLNKNKYLTQGIKYINEYVTSHPEEVQGFINELESQYDIKLSDMEINQNFYDKFSAALQNEGFIGKPGALNIVADKLIANIDLIFDSLKPKEANDELESLRTRLGMKRRKSTGEKTLEFITSSGITPEGIKQAYAESGFQGEKGVIKYVVGQIITSSKPYADAMLKQFESAGINHGMTSELLIESYKNNGFLGKEGLVEKLAEIGLKAPNVEQHIYKGLLGLALDDKKKALKAELHKVMEGASQTDINKLVNKQFNKIIDAIASQGIPEVISEGKLQAVFNQNGLFGNEGALAYIGDNIKPILAVAKENSVLEDYDIQKLEDHVSKLKAIKDFKDLQYLETKPHEKFAIAIAKKAEELEIAPLEILSNNKYHAEKKAAILEGYGSIDKYASKTKQLQDILPFVNQVLVKLKSSDITPEDIAESFSSYRPKKGILRETFDKITTRMVTKNIVAKAEDYLTLTKSVLEYRINRMQQEKEIYSQV